MYEVIETDHDTTAPTPVVRIEAMDFSNLAPLVRGQERTLRTVDVVPFLVGATVDEVEKELVIQTLAHCDGNRTHAARILGLSVRTLRNKIRLYIDEGIDVPAHA